MASLIKFDLTPLGDSAVTIRLGDTITLDIHQKVTTISAYLDEHRFPGYIECIPAFTTVTVCYNPIRLSLVEPDQLPYQSACSYIHGLLSNLTEHTAGETRVVDIPVFYGGEYGPDLEKVAEHNGLTAEEVIRIHSRGDYLVYMIGFSPGFPYLGGMSERIAMPRRSSPRLKIPAGSVGIAGKQTGVYSIETPGGWQLIGRTPLALFQPNGVTPSLLQPGDRVRFKQITREEYEQYMEVKRWG